MSLRFTNITKYIFKHWKDLFNVDNLITFASDSRYFACSKTHINSLSYEDLKKYISACPDNIVLVNNPTDELWEIAIARNGDCIKFLDNPSEKLQELAVKNSITAIGFIKNPSKRIQRLAVIDDPSPIAFIRDPDEEIQCLAVRSGPVAMRHIKNPSLKVKRILVKYHPQHALEYLDYNNPEDKELIEELRLKLA